MFLFFLQHFLLARLANCTLDWTKGRSILRYNFIAKLRAESCYESGQLALLQDN